MKSGTSKNDGSGPLVTFLLPCMGGGGTERLTIDLMTGFLKIGFNVDLVLLQKKGEFLQLVPEGVRVIGLAAPRLRFAILPLRRYFWEARPMVCLAALWPLTSAAVISALGLGVRPRIVVIEHCPLLEQYASKPIVIRILRFTIALTYRRAYAIVAVSIKLAEQVALLARLPKTRVTVVSNPIPVPTLSGLSPDNLWPPRPARRLLSVGHLKDAKNFALLIDAFAHVAQTTEAVLAIVGTGDGREALEHQISRLNLEGRVLLPGFCATPGDWYSGADLFALASNYEGFGNVLVEAMHFGLPIVATDCPTGPAEILDNGKFGCLVPVGDVQAMAEALLATLASPIDRKLLVDRANHYSVARAVNSYARLVTDPTDEKNI